MGDIPNDIELAREEGDAEALAHMALSFKQDAERLRARLAELEGQEPAGYAAQCEDGSLCYEYFTEHREGIEHALKLDCWEGMEPVPVYTTPPPSVPDGAHELCGEILATLEANLKRGQLTWPDMEGPWQAKIDEWRERRMAMLTATPAPSKPRGDYVAGKTLWPNGPLTERVGNAELVCLANDPAPPSRKLTVTDVDNAGDNDTALLHLSDGSTVRYRVSEHGPLMDDEARSEAEMQAEALEAGADKLEDAAALLSADYRMDGSKPYWPDVILEYARQDRTEAARLRNEGRE